MTLHRDPRRSLAAALFAQGASPAEVARHLGVSRTAASRWHASWRAGGAAALVRRMLRGRKPRGSLAALLPTQAAFEDPPRVHGFDLDRWSLAAIAVALQRNTGIAYHRRHVGRVLRRLGWVLLPVGPRAELAFREVAASDPDGNPIRLRKHVASAGAGPRGTQ